MSWRGDLQFLATYAVAVGVPLVIYYTAGPVLERSTMHPLRFTLLIGAVAIAWCTVSILAILVVERS